MDTSSFSGSGARNALSASIVVRGLLLDATPQERVIVSATTLFFPVIRRLPDILKETMPAAQSRAIEKRYVMRFYNVSSKGDIIEFKGHAWGVVGLFTCHLSRVHRVKTSAPKSSLNTLEPLK